MIRNTATNSPVAESLSQCYSPFTSSLTELIVRISEDTKVLSFEVGAFEIVGEIMYECNIIFGCDDVR